jgi:hypothetical protein
LRRDTTAKLSFEETNMSNDKPDETRKLTVEEMEAAKGGETYSTLKTFNVNSHFSAVKTSPLGSRADTVMCVGQTRSGSTVQNPAAQTTVRK